VAGSILAHGLEVVFDDRIDPLTARSTNIYLQLLLPYPLWVIGYGTNSTDKALVLGFRDNDRVTCAFFNDDLDTVAGVDSDGVYASGTFADTNWHHLACTYDAATRQRTVYVDGIGWKMDGSAAIQADGVFNVGRVPWGEGYFSGNIDDVRVYNRALSKEAIAWLAKGNLDTPLFIP
jgi:hypothetical protein